MKGGRKEGRKEGREEEKKEGTKEGQFFLCNVVVNTFECLQCVAVIYYMAKSQRLKCSIQSTCIKELRVGYLKKKKNSKKIFLQLYRMFERARWCNTPHSFIAFKGSVMDRFVDNSKIKMKMWYLEEIIF